MLQCCSGPRWSYDCLPHTPWYLLIPSECIKSLSPVHIKLKRQLLWISPPKNEIIHIAPEDERLLHEDVLVTPIKKDGLKR